MLNDELVSQFLQAVIGFSTFFSDVRGSLRSLGIRKTSPTSTSRELRTRDTLSAGTPTCSMCRAPLTRTLAAFERNARAGTAMAEGSVPIVRHETVPRHSASVSLTVSDWTAKITKDGYLTPITISDN